MPIQHIFTELPRSIAFRLVAVSTFTGWNSLSCRGFRELGSVQQIIVMAAVNKYGNKFTFFYTKKSPFSQFHPAEFEVAGTKYVCAEQYMMHQKAKLFGDDEIAPQILVAEKPMQMKALGRKVKNFDESVWKDNRERIVREGSIAKFSQNDNLKKALSETKGTLLVEASPRDRIWGIGLGASNPKAMDPTQWRGQNLLGKILTDVRETLMAEEN